MVKEKKIDIHKIEPPAQQKSSFLRYFLYLIAFVLVLAFTFSFSLVFYFEKNYQEKIYPGVHIDGIPFGGKTQKEVEDYFISKSQPYKKLAFVLKFENKIATLSAEELAISFDHKLSGIQAYSIGRSGHFLSDIYQKWRAVTTGINLSSILKMNTNYIDDILSSLATSINVPAEDALFQFEKGKVSLFKISKSGRELDQKETKQLILSYINNPGNQTEHESEIITIVLPVKIVSPVVSTEDSNDLGIKEFLGSGTSRFMGSIAGRIHNIVLAASRINGHLVPPGNIFSFNDTLGDVSANTGFQPAYIIKDGRTVLGDGGGVCQVSTTLFRAVLNAGLPIVERHAHSYRVSYYEQGFPPGIDATVYAPSYDLKFKNDTPNYILIQAKPDAPNYTLTFEIYGTGDGRKAEMTKPVVLSQVPPPEDLNRDDPTLSRGVVKQVDWKAWGAKVNFDYKVTKNGETLSQKSFFSNYQPWQAVFLHGTKD